MAGIAGQTSRVLRCRDLREALGLGAVGFVAAGADDGGVELRRLQRCRIVGMFGLGAVAGFARNDHMLALFLLLDHVGVANLARIVAGKGHGPGRDFGDGVASIVSILPKTVRNDEGAQRDEGNQCDRYDGREPDEVFDVLEQFMRPTPGASRATLLRNALGYLEIVAGTMIEVTGICDGGHDAPSLRSDAKRPQEQGNNQQAPILGAKCNFRWADAGSRIKCW